MKTRLVVAAAFLLSIAIVTAFAWPRSEVPSPRLVPTARVQQGRIDIMVHAIGELRASRGMPVFTPAMGGPLTIVTLPASGSPLKGGDVIVEFDAADQQFALEQAEFDLQLAQQEIVKAEAAAAATVADDEVTLLQARYSVRRAELDASANELVGAIVAQQNQIALEEAREHLTAVENEVKSHGETTAAAHDVLREKRNKAQLAVTVARRNIENLRILAPFDGFVTLKQNTQAFGGVIFSANSLPEYRVGDAAYPGNLIAEIVDTTAIEVSAKLPENDRANVAAGQAVEISVDGRPDTTLHGTVRTISSVASRQIFEAGSRRFDIAFDLAEPSARLNPGVSARLAITGQSYETALHVPRAAIFELSGKPSVYIKTNAGFAAREIKVVARTDSMAIIEGIDATAEVALIDPKAGATKGAPASAPPTQRATR
jgi:multidrug resistance efflux pump